MGTAVATFLAPFIHLSVSLRNSFSFSMFGCGRFALAASTFTVFRWRIESERNFLK